MSQHEQCLAFCSLQFFSFLPSFFSLTAGDLRRIPGAPQSRAGSSLCSSPPRQPDRLPALLPGTERSSGFPADILQFRKLCWDGLREQAGSGRAMVTASLIIQVKYKLCSSGWQLYHLLVDFHHFTLCLGLKHNIQHFRSDEKTIWEQHSHKQNIPKAQLCP